MQTTQHTHSTISLPNHEAEQTPNLPSVVMSSETDSTNATKAKKKHAHRFRSCRKPCRIKNDALEKIPKRDREVIEEGDAREEFWGLLVVEEIQFLRVFAYHVTFIAGPFVFWALWLTVMGHPGDLQGASVPFTVALGLMSLFWFPFWHR